MSKDLQGLNRLRKKGRDSDQCGENHPSGAKALLILLALSAPVRLRSGQALKSCPDSCLDRAEFFRKL
jgi:hypothetical protein